MKTNAIVLNIVLELDAHILRSWAEPAGKEIFQGLQGRKQWHYVFSFIGRQADRNEMSLALHTEPGV